MMFSFELVVLKGGEQRREPPQPLGLIIQIEYRHPVRFVKQTH